MKSLIKGRILLLIVFLLGSGILFSAYTNVGYLNKINALQNEIEQQVKQRIQQENKMFEQEKGLRSEIAALYDKLELADKKLESLPQIQAYEIEELKKKGLKDPVKDLKTDLLNHKEIIPHKGVLGGTMGFMTEEHIHVISSKWVAAYFEDGHINGIMLLKYNILKDGKIRWTVMDSFLY